jgi:hypothetical protein
MIFDMQQFEDLLRSVVREEIAKALEQKKEKLYTVEETALELRIGRSTLDKYTKLGKIIPVRIAGRPMFTEQELGRVRMIGLRHL